jgi:hypothetical protein
MLDITLGKLPAMYDHVFSETSETLDAFKFSLMDPETGEKTDLVIPRGFITDGSSIPWYARWLINRRRTRTAGLVHDYLYRTPGIGITRRQADFVWRDLAAVNAGLLYRVTSWLGFLGLRLGGWHAWYQHHRHHYRKPL